VSEPGTSVVNIGVGLVGLLGLNDKVVAGVPVAPIVSV
jgi:hypothetical protein